MKKVKIIKVIIVSTCLLIGCSSNKENDVSNTNDIQNIETENIYENTDLEEGEEEEQEEFEEESEEPSLTMEEIKTTYPDKEILVWAYDNMMEITHCLRAKFLALF